MIKFVYYKQYNYIKSKTILIDNFIILEENYNPYYNSMRFNFIFIYTNIHKIYYNLHDTVYVFLYIYLLYKY